MRRKSLSIHDQLLARIREEFPEIKLPLGIRLQSYRGPKDAGQNSWLSVGFGDIDTVYIGPIICSEDSMTSLVKAKRIGYYEPYRAGDNYYRFSIIED